jgi:hypothetical protein
MAHYELSALTNDIVATQHVTNLRRHGRRLLGADLPSAIEWPRLNRVLRGLTARPASLGNSVSDRSAVLQSVTEVHHLIEVVLIAPVRAMRWLREAVPLLPQPQRVRADVEHRGCFVDRERGSTLLLRTYRQPRASPLALYRIADGSRMGRSAPKSVRSTSAPKAPGTETSRGHAG